MTNSFLSNVHEHMIKKKFKLIEFDNTCNNSLTT